LEKLALGQLTGWFHMKSRSRFWAVVGIGVFYLK
jgi:hypothetical protein